MIISAAIWGLVNVLGGAGVAKQDALKELVLIIFGTLVTIYVSKYFE